MTPVEDHPPCMPPMRFTAAEFRASAQACRARSFTHEQAAKNASNPTVAQGFSDEARRYADLAQKLDLAATWL